MPTKNKFTAMKVKIHQKNFLKKLKGETLNKSSNSATPRRSQKCVGIKSIEFMDSNDQKNYFLKKTSTKSPNLTYLSLDTSQNEKFLKFL